MPSNRPTILPSSLMPSYIPSISPTIISSRNPSIISSTNPSSIAPSNRPLPSSLMPSYVTSISSNMTLLISSNSFVQASSAVSIGVIIGVCIGSCIILFLGFMVYYYYNKNQTKIYTSNVKINDSYDENMFEEKNQSDKFICQIKYFKFDEQKDYVNGMIEKTRVLFIYYIRFNNNFLY